RCVERLCGSLPVEGLAGSGVESVGDVVAVGLGEAPQLGAFGPVLAQQAVGVLVGAALPGRVGVGEVDAEVRLDGDVGVGGHFAAAVPGQGAAQRVGQCGDHRSQRCFEVQGGVLVGQRREQYEAGA